MLREAADLAYYFHWPRAELFSLGIRERRSWLGQITRIHEMQKKAREEETWRQFERLLAARAEEGI